MAKSKKVEEQPIVVEDEEQHGQSQVYDASMMVVLLERVETIAPLEKARMKEVLNMYSTWWDESPIIQQTKATVKLKDCERV